MSHAYLSPKHPPGEVVYCQTGYARCVSFFRALHRLEVPHGTHIGESTGTGVAAMMNGLMRDLRPETRWVWILGDDHEFRADTLKNMLIHAELYQTPILVPLVCKKTPPFDSVLFSEQTTKPLEFMDLPEGDKPLVVHSAGTAGMLVQRHVIDAMAKTPPPDGRGAPWFRWGIAAPDASDEDIFFCRRARELGFETYVDPSVSLSHIPAEVFISPKRFPNGDWYVEFRWPEGKSFSIPMQRVIR